MIMLPVILSIAELMSFNSYATTYDDPENIPLTKNCTIGGATNLNEHQSWCEYRL